MDSQLPMTRITSAPPPLRIQLEDGGRIWEMTQAALSVGRAPDCDVILDSDAYPMVSRKHLLFQWEGAGWHWRDAGTQNGILCNGQRQPEGPARPGDRLQLGPEGPVFIILANTGAAARGMPAMLPTQVMGSAMAAGAPQPNRFTARTVVQASTWQEPESAPPLPYGALPAVAPAWATPEAAAAPAAGTEAAVSGLEQMPQIRRQLAQLRQWSLVSVLLNVVLFAVLLYQIQQTQRKVLRLRQQAQNAVQLLQPRLNRRLNRFSEQIHQADAKIQTDMKKSEHQFMQKLRQQLPIMIDQYIQHKERQYHIAQPQ